MPYTALNRTTNTNSFLQLPDRHQTMKFIVDGQNVTVWTKVTLDPDEDCEVEEMSLEEARKLWRAKWKAGWRKATGWHQDKGRHPWDHDSF